jgi:hypothetical protein
VLGVDADAHGFFLIIQMMCTTPSGSQTLASTIVFSFSWRRLHSRAVCGKNILGFSPVTVFFSFFPLSFPVPEPTPIYFQCNPSVFFSFRFDSCFFYCYFFILIIHGIWIFFQFNPFFIFSSFRFSPYSFDFFSFNYSFN